MKSLSFCSHSRQETVDFARKISGFLKRGDILGLFGDLGSGKTTFVKGLAKGLGLKRKINSPSFVILKIYPLKLNRTISKHSHKEATSLYHFDLFRLRSLKELEDVGYEDFIYNSGICVIEWADKAGKLLPKHYLKIRIKIKAEDVRMINLIGYGKRYSKIVDRINHFLGRHKSAALDYGD